MFKLKRKIVLVSSIIAPILPIIAVVSCSDDKTETIDKKALNKEAEALEKGNFYYDGKSFDDEKEASTYSEIAKVSGVDLSKETTLTASSIKVVDKIKLEITYTLKNGSETSDEQTFIYQVVYPVDLIDDPAKASGLKEIASSAVKSTLIATLVSKESGEGVISAAKLEYKLISVKKDDNASDIKENFEWDQNKLKLKKGKTLVSGSYVFKITSQLKKGEGDDPTVKSKTFTFVIS